ncbi:MULTISPECIES: 16S rRNA (guanine(966)-N(2))-methyltransferase RsmD [Anaerofustis]|uniref:16S rRNA (guanine(966)-N(2))-methyltransferase RsmD n=1 Tax=Anaerofustis TaxID=264995 RepID=UPI001106C102|nr:MULTISPECIES: 16S rRNA (guanine(966)-N(2))-methyltransferase RsmD [Anaerofustis]MCO8194723.1 16S rRNA (guanine(966)-N(2))-methyltransferase RsmD [Anaerofustis sp. NSJ-163]
MRVIGGKMRGTNLDSPKDRRVRPTTDRIKEDLFNILMPYIPESKFLDLFGGSGAIGIEAISRGADKSYFIDNNMDSIRLIRKNIKKTRCEEFCKVIKKDALSFVNNTEEKFDVIFLDPPYKYEKLKILIENIVKCDILCNDGILVVEHDKNIPIGEFEHLTKIRSKSYSLTSIDFFVLED